MSKEPQCNKDLRSRPAENSERIVAHVTKICEDMSRHFELSERLDTIRDIARYLGVSESYFYAKIRDKMDYSGILFTRGRPGGHRMIFTYKRLVLAWLIMSGGNI